MKYETTQDQGKSMCGICAKIYLDRNRKIEEESLRLLNNLLSHRGPDDEGYYIEGNVGLGHRRLSIIDLARGHQPILNEDRTVAIVFNGEIYNQHDLREELEKKGHRFATSSDTEVILHLYEEYGERCVERLRGMFAFAIWDDRKKLLFAARDRVGKKPIFYALLEDRFLLSSELKSFLVDEKMPREVNYSALHDYLTFQYVPAPQTIYKAANELPAAHYLVLKDGKIKTERYWDLNYEPKLQISEEEALARTESLIDEAVKIRLESEVPLGCFLSGGVDSSAVVAFMRRHISGDLKTFSIGFEEDEYNELPYARKVAELFSTRHEEFVVRPNAIEVLPKLVWHFDQPYADSSALPTYYVSLVTKKYVTVALDGDGGDESFLGYERYKGFRAFNRYSRVPMFIRKFIIQKPAEFFFSLLPGSTFFEKAYYLNTVSLYNADRLYAQTMVIFRDYMKRRMYSPELSYLARNFDSLELTLRYFNDDKAKNLVECMNRSDIMTYLPGALLPKVDRTSMANGLECRAPFLDQELMQYAARLPIEIRFGDGVLKHHLKKVLSKHLPHDILWRKKMGFGVPIGKWFRTNLFDFARETILSAHARQRGFFDMKYIEKILLDHKKGRQNHHHRLWTLLCLEVWCRTFLDRSDIQSGPIAL